MEIGSYIEKALRMLSEIKKASLHFLLLSFFFIPILLILFLDFFNIEAFGSFNQRFMFDLTWKGRMFYLFFLWLLLLETILDWEFIVEKQNAFRNRFRVFLACIFAAVPTFYILSVNFFGLNQTILNIGQALQIRQDFISDSWPLSVEYLILLSFFIFATWLAYGFSGLRSSSISLSLLGGIGVIYLLDTIWPYGTFKPMELLAVPTAAFATALLNLLGYEVELTFPSPYIPPQSLIEYGSMPYMLVDTGMKSVGAHIGWPCAGVHSLLLFILITLVFFKKTTIQRDRKIVFFLIGAAGTYLTNVFRIASYFTISINYGPDAGEVFHNSYGELYFVAWMFLYFIVIVTIQSGRINKFTQALRKRAKSFRIYGNKCAENKTRA